MSSFDDREKAFEAKFQHDQEMQFRIQNRRNKLLGLWAADLLGLKGDEADAYAKQVVIADFDEPGDADVFRKVFGDLTCKSVDVSEHRVRRQMEELLDTARQQIMTETGT